MTKGICTPYNSLFNSELQIAIRKFNGILVRNTCDYIFYKANRNLFPKSMTESLAYIQSFPELPLYIDEPISTPEKHKEIWEWLPKSIIGELTDRAFDKIDNSITYTAYTKLIDVFGWFRLSLFWTNQLSTWEHIRKTYINEFPFVWVHLTKNEKDFDELKQWAVKYNKGIWVYCPEGLKTEDLINRINKLNL
jgi:hypothetical protein